MELDLSLQRALDGVELVSGTIGNPSDGRMCLMLLVAFLAGEDHTDLPHGASPLIQAFAIRNPQQHALQSSAAPQGVCAADRRHQRRI